MYSIFLNYRREPHEVAVAAIAERLQRYFGHDEVFIDNGIPSGDEYPETLESRLRGCTVLVAVIHKGWLDSFEKPRPKDWVRHEITIALERGITVIPVLLGKADMPAAEQMPSDIRALARRQATPVSSTTYEADIRRLIHRLERHVGSAPPEKPATKPPRIWLRFLAWTLGAFLATVVLFHTSGTWWQFFAFPAFFSATALVLVSTLTAIGVTALKRHADRWERRAGKRGIRDLLASWGVIPAVVGVLSAFSTVNEVLRDGRAENWELVYLAMYFTAGPWFLWRWIRRATARDEDWPPIVTTEHAVFRRAAYRLEQRLTTDEEWRRDRTRTVQREAVSIYLDLAEARRDLGVRGRVSITRWVRNAYRSETIAYLGWFASIIALDLAASGVMVFGGAAPQHALRVIGITIAGATTFAAAGVFATFQLDRRDVRRWTAEIVEWQHRLGPLIFCAHDNPVRQEHR
jgi:hypothetical protein